MTDARRGTHHQVGWTMKRYVAVAFLGISLASLGSFSGAAVATEVRPHSLGSIAWDVSTRPVETTLHKYNRARSRYTVTGESVTFRFPAAYYFWIANQKGGAQRRITLDVDRVDLGAIRPALNELRRPERFLTSRPEIADLEGRRTDIHVLSSLSAYDPTLRKIKRGELRALGEAYCGLDMYVEVDTRQRDSSIAQSPTTPQYPFSKVSTFVSAERTINDRSANDFAFKAKCDPNTRKGFCNVSSYLDVWPIEFKIQKDKLCDWRQETDRIRDFLARHIVRSTPASPAK